MRETGTRENPSSAPSASDTTPEQAQQDHVVGESRWPMAGAVVAAMILSLLLPRGFGPGRLFWLFPAIEGALLIAVIVTDPGRIDRRAKELRWLSIGLVSVLVIGALGATLQLISDLIQGGPETHSAGALLRAGAIVWVSNNIAFALLYWELDGGGAAARAHGMKKRLDLAFPQQLSPDGWEDWRPRFIDYLYLGFTNSTAFSPTDVMPLVPWAKMTMLVQSLISLAVLSLVVANAVNLFG